jgi:hypothetical protein
VLRSMPVNTSLEKGGGLHEPYLKALNASVLLKSAKRSRKSSLRECLTCQPNSRQRTMNRIKLKTCNAKPAIMIWTPVSEVTLLPEVEVMPPPMDCKTKDVKSQLIKVIAYVRG